MHLKLEWFRLSAMLIMVTLPTGLATQSSAHSLFAQHSTSAFLLAQTPAAEFNYENYDFWVEQCLMLSAQQQYAEALTSCEKAITLEPKQDNTEIWFARSNALFQMGKYPESFVSYAQVIANSPRHSGAMAHQCAALFQLQQYDTAIDRCAEALQMDGDWGTVSPGFAWYYHGLALQASGRLETAFGSFVQAVRLNPEDELAKAECLTAALEINSPDAERSCDPQAMMAESSDADSQSEAFAQSQASPEAVLRQVIRVTEQALADDPSRPTVWFQQGVALEQLGEYERALTAFDRALQLHNRSLTLTHRCAVLNALERYESALESCNQAFQSDHRWGQVGVSYAWTQQSLALLGLGRLEEALAAVERAIDGESVDMTVALTPSSDGILATESENMESENIELESIESNNIQIDNIEIENLEYDREYSSVQPENIQPEPEVARPYAAVALTQRSNVLLAMERYDEAVAAAGEAIQRDPTYAAALNSQAVGFWRLSELEQAETAISQALELYNQPQIRQETFENTDYIEPLALRLRGQILAAFNQGRILSSLEAPDQAIVSYDQALLLYNQANQRGVAALSKPLLAELWLNRGVAYLYFSPDEASQSFETAVNLAPERFEGWYNWALALTRLGEYDRATRAYDQAEQLQPNNAAVQSGRLQIMLGRANDLENQGKIQDAIALYDQVLTLDPTNSIAAQRLQQLVQSSVGAGR
jgi:tetratricopeptide (TPR) repeat protein